MWAGSAFRIPGAQAFRHVNTLELLFQRASFRSPVLNNGMGSIYSRHFSPSLNHIIGTLLRPQQWIVAGNVLSPLCAVEAQHLDAGRKNQLCLDLTLSAFLCICWFSQGGSQLDRSLSWLLTWVSPGCFICIIVLVHVKCLNPLWQKNAQSKCTPCTLNDRAQPNKNNTKTESNCKSWNCTSFICLGFIISKFKLNKLIMWP